MLKMFFDSLFLTVIVCIACIVGAFFSFSFLHKFGNKKLKKKEFFGLCIVSFLMVCAIFYAFFTDFGQF